MIKIFQERLLPWYHEYGRNLPWRHTRNPYHILLSEFMLHQTQVSRVIPKYHEFLIAYPSFSDLANASEEDIVKIWYPLGYNFRPRRLHQIAKIVVNEWGGQLPSDLDILIQFPGIGRYTAGAILNFAFHQDAPILDTNVRRVLARFFGVSGDLYRSFANRQLWTLAEEIIPPQQGYIFNQALMDFGALICTARLPQCLDCIYESYCFYYISQNGSTD